jgi:hypothetical protein
MIENIAQYFSLKENRDIYCNITGIMMDKKYNYKTVFIPRAKKMINDYENAMLSKNSEANKMRKELIYILAKKYAMENNKASTNNDNIMFQAASIAFKNYESYIENDKYN